MIDADAGGLVVMRRQGSDRRNSTDAKGDHERGDD
jgi:hypothetical protein